MEPKKVANSWRVSAAMTGLTGRNSLGLFHCLGPTAIVIVFWQLQLQVLGLQLELDCRRTGFRNTRLSPFTLPKSNPLKKKKKKNSREIHRAYALIETKTPDFVPRVVFFLCL